MSDQVLPISLVPSAVEWRLVDNVAAFAGAAGAIRTRGRPGLRWAARLTFRNLNGASRHRMMALIAAFRGRQNRIWITDASMPMRGNMTAPELLTNADLSSATGWSTTVGTVSARNGVLRLKPAAGTPNTELYQTPAATVAFAPYAMRSAFLLSKGWAAGVGETCGNAMSNGAFQVQNYISGRGLLTSALTAVTAGNVGCYAFVDIPTTAAIPTATHHEFIELQYASVARCLLVDNGANSLLRSDEIDNAAWSKSNVTVSANTATAPDGTATADEVIETVANGAHLITQTANRTSAIAELCAYGWYKQTGLTRDVRIICGNEQTNYSECTFNLAAGTKGAVANNGTSTNGRAFIVAGGSGWYYCAVVATAAAATTMVHQPQFNNAGSTSYAGSTSAKIAMWRVGMAISAQPTRGGLTTTAALELGTSQALDSVLNVKGGPPGADMLRAGDMVEIILSGLSDVTRSQFVRLLDPVDFNAAGIGQLRFEPPLRRAPTDNMAVIVTKPLCRMFIANNEIQWSTRRAGFTDFALDLIEDIPP